MTKTWIRKIDAKGQITIPAELRSQLGLHPGTRVVLWRENDCIKLQSLTSWEQQPRTKRKR